MFWFNLKKREIIMSIQIPQLTANRRVFLMQTALGCAGAATVLTAHAQSMVAENDPQAKNLGYKANASTVDKSKNPKYASGQVCNNCALFQGAATAAAGACPLFAGKQVAGKGWCTAWAKKG
jgi:High potential iron-sulfur protein